MNRALLIINVVLVVAVAVLYFLFFDQKKPVSRKVVSESSKSADASYKIAYFEMDSVEANFALWKDMQKELDKKEESMTAELTRMQMNLQQKAQAFQEQGPTMTAEQVDNRRNELMQLDANLQSRRKVLEQQYQSFLVNKQQQILSMIRDFCRDYNKNHDYALIIAHEPGLIFYKDTVYNITSELLKGLDSMYRSKK